MYISKEEIIIYNSSSNMMMNIKRKGSKFDSRQIQDDILIADSSFRYYKRIITNAIPRGRRRRTHFSDNFLKKLMSQSY